MIRALRRLLAAAETSAPTNEVDDCLLFAETLLDEGREELTRADGKASILLSAAGVAGGALIAAALASRWDPTKFGSKWAEAASWAAIALAALGIAGLASAVMPRTRHTGDRNELAYFGHVVKFRPEKRRLDPADVASAKAELQSAIQKAGTVRLQRVVDQVWTVSLIVDKKYRRIRWALNLFGAAAAASAVAVVIEHITTS